MRPRPTTGEKQSSAKQAEAGRDNEAELSQQQHSPTAQQHKPQKAAPVLQAVLRTVQKNSLALTAEKLLSCRQENRHKKLPSKASATTFTKTFYQAPGLSACPIKGKSSVKQHFPAHREPGVKHRQAPSATSFQASQRISISYPTENSTSLGHLSADVQNCPKLMLGLKSS